MSATGTPSGTQVLPWWIRPHEHASFQRLFEDMPDWPRIVTETHMAARLYWGDPGFRASCVTELMLLEEYVLGMGTRLEQIGWSAVPTWQLLSILYRNQWATLGVRSMAAVVPHPESAG